MINGDPVSWASKKQKVVAQSTCEAELYAEAAAINETKWLSDLLSEIGLQHDRSAGDLRRQPVCSGPEPEWHQERANQARRGEVRIHLR